MSSNDKEALRLIRIAYRNGATVPFSMRYMLELNVSLKIIKAVLRGTK